MNEARVETWDRRMRPLLIALGILFLAAYSVYVLAPVSGLVGALLLLFMLVVWIVFAVDFFARLAMTPKGHRWQFVRENPIDLLAVVLPVFRVLRALDGIQNLQAFNHRIGSSVRTKIALSLGVGGLIYVYFMALTVYDNERDAAHATIKSFGDAVWWSFETIFTVGYGDYVPVTITGRVSAVLLMIGGFVLLGIATGTVVSAIGAKLRTEDHH